MYGWYTGVFPALRLYAALLAIVLIAYANAFGLGFALDGRHVATADTRVRAATAANVQRIFSTDYWWPVSVDPLYRPATTLSFLVNYAVLGNGTDPLGYHAVNILLHAGNVWMVFALALLLLRDRWPAFFAAAIWAVHPIGVESVANIAGRADLLAAAGMLGALLVYAAAPRKIWAIAPLAALAAFSKETGAMLVGLMALWDLTPRQDKPASWRSKLPAYAAALAPLALYAWMRSGVLGALPYPMLPHADNPLRDSGFLSLRWTAIKLVGSDLLLLVWPAKLACDRAFSEILPASFTDPGAWAALLIVAGILGAVLYRRRTDPVLFWAAGFFGLTLLPASNLIVPINATMAERFLYLPSIGFAVALAALVYRFAPRHAAAGLGIVAALFAARTLVRNPNWNNEIALMSHDAQVVPRSFRVHDLLGEFLYAADVNNLDRAIVELEQSWEIMRVLPPEKNTPQIPGALGSYYVLKGDRFPAGSPEGKSLVCEGRRRSAAARDEITRVGERLFEEAQSAHGRPPAPRRDAHMLYLLLGNAHFAQDHFAEALAAYRYGLGSNPSVPELYDRSAAVLRRSGDPGAAARIELQKAFALGLTPELLAGVERAYQALPDGACATVRTNGVPLLNVQCPRLRQDLCPALTELEARFTEARAPDRARSFKQLLVQYGCAASR